MELTLTEIIQLAALGPCIFITIYLFISAREYKLIIIPAIYFVALTVTFFTPILELITSLSENNLLKIILFNEALLPSLSFLFIAQLILRKVPSAIYWSVILLPICGNAPFIFRGLSNSGICDSNNNCGEIIELINLYSLFSGALIFLLITVILSRKHSNIEYAEQSRRHKYWLIVMMILYNVLILFITALQLNNLVDAEQSHLSKIIIGIGFVYLILSSVFRVFNQNFRIIPLQNIINDRDYELINRIYKILDEQKPYLVSGYNRGDMADSLALTEQHLSRVINKNFGKSFTDLLNEKRIKVAQELLRESGYNVTEIAFRSGFNSIATFNRVFKEFANISPSQYRKQELNG